MAGLNIVYNKYLYELINIHTAFIFSNKSKSNIDMNKIVS